MEYTNASEIFRHFQVASNELSSPKILVCPEDKGRVRALSFDQNFSNRNLSYFVGLGADETSPQTVLSGDRTITTNGRIMSGILTLTINSPVSWAKGLHQGCGNILSGDGSVFQASDAMLKNIVVEGTNLPTRLAIP